jgi:Winged helix DNA-binding domain
MTLDLTRRRLANQRLSRGHFTKPEDVVSWLGAVQAQEYSDTKWALGLRMQRAADAQIERAFSEGRILRTHVMRPTWHFVAPQDIRWMLALTGPRVSARMAPYNRRLELDPRIFRRSERAIVRALRGGAQLTRQELKARLQRAGVLVDGTQRLAHLVMQAELDAVICSGPRRGTQFTYALLDERVPASRPPSRDDALAELTRRYFRSHGPAQLRDFVWWSGLTAADARAGLAIVERELVREIVEGRPYWFTSPSRALVAPPPAYLLPLYDEYLIAYKDRSAALDPSRWNPAWSRDPFSAPIVVNGRVVGGWRRIVKQEKVVVVATPFGPLNKRERLAVADAARAFSAFLGIALELSWK